MRRGCRVLDAYERTSVEEHEERRGYSDGGNGGQDGTAHAVPEVPIHDGRLQLAADVHLRRLLPVRSSGDGRRDVAEICDGRNWAGSNAFRLERSSRR
jgi:hypothetical protein